MSLLRRFWGLIVLNIVSTCVVLLVSGLVIFHSGYQRGLNVLRYHPGDCYDLAIDRHGALHTVRHDDCVCGGDCLCSPNDCRCLWERINPAELPQEIRTEMETMHRSLVDAVQDVLTKP